MLRVTDLLDWLASEKLITTVSGSETAEDMVKDKRELVRDLYDKFREAPQVHSLALPLAKDCFCSFFEYPQSWLLYTVAYVKFLSPGTDPDRVSGAVQRRLDETAL